MANAEISILGREAHAIESTRSTFSLQSLMLILIRSIYLFATSYLWERECMCESTNPLAYLFIIVFISSTLLAIYFHYYLLYCYLLSLHPLHLLNLITTITITITCTSPYTIRNHHHLHLHLICIFTLLYFIYCIS